MLQADAMPLPRVQRSKFSRIAAAAALFSLFAAEPRDARATVVERIVAVVGEQPILLTELQQRARPHLLDIYSHIPAPQQQLEIASMYKELLGKLVDERVVAAAADKLHITATAKEVDNAIKLKIADLRLTMAEFLQEAARQGLSENDYREEVRRQLLFGKMLETRVQGRVRPTEDDAREYYKRLLVQERRAKPFRASVITIDLARPDGTSQRAVADQIVAAARKGEDFATLARMHSVDAWRDRGGDAGTRSPGGFAKEVDAAALRLDVGEISEPIVAGSSIVIVKVTERPPSQLPAFDTVHDVVVNRVRDELLQKQVKVWLDELKIGMYIDVRL